MNILESSIDADTDALNAVAEHFPNIDIVYKAYGDSLPYRWEVQSIEPRQYLGEIGLTSAEINLTHTARRVILRRKLLEILRETGQDH